MIGSRLIKSNDVAAGCEDIVDNYDPFDGNGVALYQLNGNADDVSGNYNGTATNVTYGTGVFGQAGVFNGSSSKVNLPDGAGSTGAVTVSTWINTNNIATTQGIWSFGTPLNTTTYGIEALIESSYVFFRIFNQNGTIGLIVQTGVGFISNNTWHNVVCVFSNTSTTNACKIYIDGAEIAAGTFTLGSITRNTTNSGFGGRFYSGSLTLPFNGEIDQVRIFNKGLDPLEVEALYTEELCICGGTVDTLDILDDSSCIALYPLDGNANDLSGNYSGTPTDVSYGVGEFDLAGVFNGSSSYINTTFTPSLANFRTISLWFKCSTQSDTKNIFNVGPTGSSDNYPWAYCYMRTDGKLSLGYGASNGGVVYGVVSNNTFNDNNWHNLIIIFNGSYGTGSSVSFYVDGNSESGTVDTTWNTSLATIKGILRLGATRRDFQNDYQRHFDGEIDQVRVFNKELNSTEVTTLYNETACTPVACTSGTTNTLDILGDGSCIATYTLDGTPADLSGNYNGVQTDVTYPQGEFDLAGAFNGSSSFVNLGATNQFQSPQVTISFWVKPTSFSSQMIIANSNGGSFAEGDFQVVIRTDGYIGYEIGISSSIYEAKYCTTTQLQLNAWNNVVLVLNSSLGTNISKIYVNNIDQSLVNGYPPGGTFSGNLLIGTLQLNLGKRNISGNEVWLSSPLDQVRIFNKALSAGEVTTLYNETACN